LNINSICFFNVCLNITSIELELISDVDMYHFVEKCSGVTDTDSLSLDIEEDDLPAHILKE